MFLRDLMFVSVLYSRLWANPLKAITVCSSDIVFVSISERFDEFIHIFNSLGELREESTVHIKKLIMWGGLHGCSGNFWGDPNNETLTISRYIEAYNYLAGGEVTLLSMTYHPEGH
jgi:hypothetical protein